ncbi:hypothetical protein SLEP1_g34083 [Rubroshorea leprosula]|uniref:Protein kinase domain-containing protein n=1 Tax=Rubroshorea leprosula TaxID=152421 RepID=A0AAV5KIN0_9ROSI|nr:hypothetical protein SLEP1_g34083 [Rubroshorea leprosula]
MGCICSKGTGANEHVESNHSKDRVLGRSSRKLSAPAARENIVVEADAGCNEATARLISNQHGNQNNCFAPASSSDEEEKKAMAVAVEKTKISPQLHRRHTMETGVKGGQGQSRMSRIGSAIPGERGAQVVAGWPSWLAAVAGEAINGWVPRKADSFEKLEKIGQGTYSSVYKARDLESNKIVALKKVRFANMDPESVRFMAREIIILRRLDHPNVMKLEGLITSRVSGSLYLVFKYMEHDLAGLAATPGVNFTQAQIKCYMQQLLRGLEHCHSRGILHRDIKGSNLLIDYNGNLKIGDFGLATFYRPTPKQPLTSRVVTLWYRPPELLLGATDYGVAVDLWSSGCILAELFAGKPIMPGRTEVEQLHKIFKLCGSPSEEYWRRSKLPHATIFKPSHPYRRCVAETFKDFPKSALALMDVLLAIQPEHRGTASLALQSEFFTTKPFPCAPSSLPKYPPSKEFDAKLREEEARRRKAAAGKGRGHESVRNASRESTAVPAPDANAELQASIQKQRRKADPTSVSEQYNPEEEAGSGFPMEPPKGTKVMHSHFGPSMHPSNYGSTWNMNTNEGQSIKASTRAFGSPRKPAEIRTQTSYINPGAAELSRFSHSVATSRGKSHFDTPKESGMTDECFSAGYNHLDNGGASENHELSHLLLDKPKNLHKKDEQSFKESTMGYVTKQTRIHYSGPLLPSGGNLEEMLKEHERQIQNAVRKSRLDKTKTKNSFDDKGQTEALLCYGTSGR